MLVRIGSRGSRLALIQAEQAASALKGSGVEVAFVPITTAGDRDRSKPFGEIGARGVFVKELEEALLAGRIDIAVHSAKDMTSTDADGLAVGAYLVRDDPRDALVLAACGLDRLGLGAEIGLRLPAETMLPETGQGALALQVREGEVVLVASADDPETRRRVEAERRCVAVVGGGCLAPVAAHHDGLVLEGLVANEDGRWVERRRGGDPEAVGRELSAAAAAHR